MSWRGASLESVTPELAARIVADSRDRVAWVRARSRGITATDVASLTSLNAIPRAADAKLMGSGFSGNAYTAHGRLREPAIAAWVAATHGIQPSSALFHAVVEKRHLATPDGIGVDASGRIRLAEIKTTNKAWPSARVHMQMFSPLPRGTFPGVDDNEVYAFLDRHA